MCKTYKPCIGPELRCRALIKLIDRREELCLIKVKETVEPVFNKDGQQAVGLFARRKGVYGLSESPQLG